eukprot:TRINITY_DN17867_c0_g1_i1.p1 TRINITY_DN17867_c0_g1~~TRINITY_DN17867_c0_g1_i1.p1  ORF type:complete len:250 (+),score=36.37 TRINITY_DN17867_c0_g1_i1:2-751(+)
MNCVVCSLPIPSGAKKFTSEGCNFHEKCFICDRCSEPLVLLTFTEINGKRVCHTCKNKDKCFHCGYIIGNSPSLEVDNHIWHKSCFVCSDCRTPLQKFVEKDGQYFCPICIDLAEGNICSKCNKPLAGKITKALGKKWHDECFVCHECHKVLGDKFNNKGGLPFCDRCNRMKSGKNVLGSSSELKLSNLSVDSNKISPRDANNKISPRSSNTKISPRGADPKKKFVSGGDYEKVKNDEGNWNDLADDFD